MTTPEPLTAAGKSLTRGYPDDLTAPDPTSVVRVEQEARSDTLAEVEKAVRELPVSETYLPDPDKPGAIRVQAALSRAAVLHVIQEIWEGRGG